VYRFGLVLFAFLISAPGAQACSVPVFRYALERWTPASLRMLVFHRGELVKADRERLIKIAETTRAANVRIEPIDLNGEVTAELRAVWDQQDKSAKLPRVVLRYPDVTSEVPSLWTGTLDESQLSTLIQSPARQQLFERLTSGSAAAVLLVLSGDRVADDAARAMLVRELPRIAARLELPVATEEGPQVQSLLPMRFDFPIVEVPATAAEGPLRQMLLASEDGLADVRGPIAFPVFGRGRALCSLHGKDLEKPGELHRSLEFLCKACSCQVKELNPGVDLLIAGNWDRIFDAERGPMPRGASDTNVAETRPTSAGSIELAEGRSPPPAGYAAVESESDSDSPRKRPMWLRLVRIGAMVGIVFVVLSCWRAMRDRQAKQSGGQADAAG
jgi:hypothetical protein